MIKKKKVVADTFNSFFTTIASNLAQKQKAFDTIQYDVLLNNLKALGLSQV